MFVDIHSNVFPAGMFNDWGTLKHEIHTFVWVI